MSFLKTKLGTKQLVLLLNRLSSEPEKCILLTSLIFFKLISSANGIAEPKQVNNVNYFFFINEMKLIFLCTLRLVSILLEAGMFFQDLVQANKFIEGYLPI